MLGQGLLPEGKCLLWQVWLALTPSIHKPLLAGKHELSPSSFKGILEMGERFEGQLPTVLGRRQGRQPSVCEKTGCVPAAMAYLALALFLLECFKMARDSLGAGRPGLGGRLLAGGLFQLNKPKWIVDSGHSPPASASDAESNSFSDLFFACGH